MTDITAEELQWAINQVDSLNACGRGYTLQPEAAVVLKRDYWDDPGPEADCIYGISLGLLVAERRREKKDKS